MEKALQSGSDCGHSKGGSVCSGMSSLSDRLRRKQDQYSIKIVSHSGQSMRHFRPKSLHPVYQMDSSNLNYPEEEGPE